MPRISNFRFFVHCEHILQQHCRKVSQRSWFLKDLGASHHDHSRHRGHTLQTLSPDDQVDPQAFYQPLERRVLKLQGNSAPLLPSTKPEHLPRDKPEPQLADYGTPPEGWDKSKHHFHYGWPVSTQIMSSVLYQLPFEHPEEPELYPGVLSFRLEIILGFQGVNVVLCKPDDFCEREGRITVIPGDNKKYTDFVSIGCTYSPKYLWRRPTPEGLQYLIKLFGEYPRWMEDSTTKSKFRVWTIR